MVKIKVHLKLLIQSSAQRKPDMDLEGKCENYISSTSMFGHLKQFCIDQRETCLQCYRQPAQAAILTLSTSSSILLVSGTSGALGTLTIIGVRVLPRVPMEAVLTTWGCVGGPESGEDTKVGNS